MTRKHSRRSFLSATSFVAATALARPSQTLAADAKIYRAAVIGHTGRGDYGHGMDKVWKDVPRADLVAVADANEQGLAKALAALGDVKGFADYKQMLKEVKPELVAVGPRWLDQHRDMVVAAAESGVRGIYLEKPMCRSLEEADEMVAACEKNGTKLAIATQTRYSPQVRIIKGMIESGQLGRIVEYRIRGKDDRRGGGEDLWVLGTHVLDLMRHFGGDAQHCFATVLQNGHPVTATDVKDGNEGIGPLAGDEVHAMFRLASGATGYFDSMKDARGEPSRFGIRIYGTKGVVELFDTGPLPTTKYLPASSWSTGRSEKQWIPITSNGIDAPETISNGGLHGGNVLAVSDLISAIENDRQPKASVYEARKTVEMIAAVFESHRLNAPVSLPLKNRKNPLSFIQ